MSEGKKKKSITTKKGDKGSTSLLGGKSVSKASTRPEAYGTLDEASAFIGLARAKIADEPIKKNLLRIQNMIFLVNAELACPPDSKARLKKCLDKSLLDEVEEMAARIEKELDLPAKFVIYGECETSALLDVARAVVRRAERALEALDEEEPLNNEFIKAFVNRLSDILYLLARFVETKAGSDFRHPEGDHGGLPLRDG